VREEDGRGEYARERERERERERGERKDQGVRGHRGNRKKERDRGRLTCYDMCPC